jgi:hypothetical protein
MSPFSKLVRIRESIFDTIYQEIAQYYNGATFFTNIDRGDLLSILFYVLAMTEVDDLAAQLSMITNFIPENV